MSAKGIAAPQWTRRTLAAQALGRIDEATRAVVPPIHVTTTFIRDQDNQYRSGNIKAYAVMTKSRWFVAPEVPTAEEAGVPGLLYSTWHGLWTPKGTPPDVVARINAAANAAMADPETQQRIAKLGMDLPPADRRTPAAFALSASVIVPR